jgi:hypothetical protein
MYSLSRDSEWNRQEWKSPPSYGLRDIVRMHPDDVIALKAWVLAKRLYECQFGSSHKNEFVHSYVTG